MYVHKLVKWTPTWFKRLMRDTRYTPSREKCMKELLDVLTSDYCIQRYLDYPPCDPTTKEYADRLRDVLRFQKRLPQILEIIQKEISEYGYE